MSDQDYKEMIEIPVSSCEMVNLSKAPKKTSQKRLLLKINKKFNSWHKNKQNQSALTESSLNTSQQPLNQCLDEDKDNLTEESSKPLELTGKKSHFKFDLITAQVIVIFVLALTILLSSVFWQDSGLNNLFKSVFSSETTSTDQRGYEVFKAFSPSKLTATLENGIITVEEPGAIYSPAKGKVTEVSQNDGKYTVTINHSDIYKTVISGVDYLYSNLGDEVFTSTPVCYSLEGGAQIAMYNENALISNYTIQDGEVVWQN